MPRSRNATSCELLAEPREIAYRDCSGHGVMIKTLFLTGAGVDEFVHLRFEDLHLDDEAPTFS